MSEGLRIRRILVALDASQRSLWALEAAVALAANLRAELEGLFVEDIDLLRAAALPFAHEVSAIRGTRPLREELLEQRLRGQALHLQRTFDRLVAAAEVKGGFRVVRGSVGQAVREAAAAADLVAIGGGRHSGQALEQPGAPLSGVVLRSGNAVVVLQAPPNPRRPVFALFDGSDRAFAALGLAVELARTQGSPLQLLIAAADLGEGERLRAQAEAWLVARQLSATFTVLVRPSAGQIARWVCRRDAGLLVAFDHALPRGDSLQDLLDELECPLWLVR